MGAEADIDQLAYRLHPPFFVFGLPHRGSVLMGTDRDRPPDVVLRLRGNHPPDKSRHRPNVLRGWGSRRPRSRHQVRTACSSGNRCSCSRVLGYRLAPYGARTLRCCGVFDLPRSITFEGALFRFTAKHPALAPLDRTHSCCVHLSQFPPRMKARKAKAPKPANHHSSAVTALRAASPSSIF